MMNNNIPCKDCLCLAICRSKYNEKDSTLFQLTDKCSLLNNYLFNNDESKTNYRYTIDVTEVLLETLSGDESE